MWEILFNLLKSDEAKIVAILILYVALGYIAKLLLKLKNNHFVHTDAAIEALRTEVRQDISGLRGDMNEQFLSINEYLREKK